MYLQRMHFTGDSNGIANQVQLHIQQSLIFDTEICYKHHKNCLQNHVNTYSISIFLTFSQTVSKPHYMSHNEPPQSIEVFVNNIDLTFLSFLYKISIEVSQSCLQWDFNSQHWPSVVYKSYADPTVLSRQACADSFRFSDPYKAMLYWI